MTIDLQSLNVELRGLKPPIPRDRLIFEAVVVQRRGQQEVAEEHGISQPRVSIIVAEVTAWLCRVLPEAVKQEPAEGQLSLGFWLAKARLEFLYGKATETFEESRQKKVVHKQWKRNDVSWEQTTTVNQSAKVRGSRFKVRGARCEVQGARCEVRGARCEVRGARCEY